jgi:RNA polymerase sigma factor (sigma-70 family)
MTANFQNDDSFEIMIISFKQGDQACLGELYDQYAPALLGVITQIVGNPELSADCLQHTFNEIWKEKTSYDFKKERIFTWMMKIARNSALNFLKNGHDSFVDHKLKVTAEDTFEVDKDVNLQANKFEIGSSSTVPQQNKILDLVYLKGYTLVQAAGRLNISVETARIQFVTAIKQLKTKIPA